MLRKHFPAIKKYNKFIFCDNAGGSQLPKHVIKNLDKFLVNNYVQPNSNNFLSKKITNDFTKVKNITDIILNNKKGDVVFGSSGSQLFYNLANSFDSKIYNIDKNIILPNFSHESCITPFERMSKIYNMEVRWWNLENNFNINYDILLNRVDSNTSLVVLPHVSNILGNVNDIKYLNNEIKKINSNTKILVDGIAYLPHYYIDVDNMGIDFYCISYYKFCGLRVSALYIKNMSEINNQNHFFFKDIKYINAAKKLEIGGWNFESANSVIGLEKYFLEILKVNNKEEIFNRNNFIFCMDKIKEHEDKLVKQFYKKLKNNNEVTILESNNYTKFPIFSLLFNNYKCFTVNIILNELGLITSNSTYYCDRLFDYHNICKLNGVLRISLMHYNTIKEVNTICKYINMFRKYDLQFIYNTYYYKPSMLLQKSFNYIKKDKYYENLRYRAFSLLNIENLENIKIIGDLNFYQESNYNNYNGNFLREYDNLDDKVVNDKSFINYVNIFKNKIYEEIGEKPEYIQVHQIRVNALSNKTNLIPEGIHRDGFNIICIIIINRVNILGGINNIYDNNKNIIYSKKMKNGEMIIINDRNLYHDVTNIILNNKNKIGYRDVFVFTTIS